jgi:hypothetical protein
MQIAAHERRKRLLRTIKQRMNPKPTAAPTNQVPPPQAPPQKETRTKGARTLGPEHDVLPRTPPRQHHHISESKRTYLHALDLPDDFPDDPALTVSFYLISTLHRTHMLFRASYRI